MDANCIKVSYTLLLHVSTKQVFSSESDITGEPKLIKGATSSFSFLGTQD